MLEAWLRPKGLSFNEDKTRVVDIDTGFDFVGFNVRRYGKQAVDQTQSSGDETDPGTAPGRGEGLCEEPTPWRWSARSTRSCEAGRPTTGTVVSSEAFSSLDNYMWKLTYKWATHGHQNKSRHWVVDRSLRPVQSGQTRPVGVR